MNKSNFNEANIKFISKSSSNNSNKECTMIQKSNFCKVTPAISAMKKSADYLID